MPETQVGNLGTRRLRGAAACAIFGLVSSGCVSLTPGGERVRTTSNPDVVRGCTYIGPVKTHASGFRGGWAASNTEATIRNKTAEMGGNVVYIITSGGQSTGDAYRCPDSSVAPGRP